MPYAYWSVRDGDANVVCVALESHVSAYQLTSDAVAFHAVEARRNVLEDMAVLRCSFASAGTRCIDGQRSILEAITAGVNGTSRA